MDYILDIEKEYGIVSHITWLYNRKFNVYHIFEVTYHMSVEWISCTLLDPNLEFPFAELVWEFLSQVGYMFIIHKLFLVIRDTKDKLFYI